MLQNRADWLFIFTSISPLTIFPIMTRPEISNVLLCVNLSLRQFWYRYKMILHNIWRRLLLLGPFHFKSALTHKNFEACNNCLILFKRPFLISFLCVNVWVSHWCQNCQTPYNSLCSNQPPPVSSLLGENTERQVAEPTSKSYNWTI